MPIDHIERKLAAILAADQVGFSRLVGADEDRTLARLRTLRRELFDPTTALHHGRVVKRTGDGLLVEFRSVVDAVRYAIAVQRELLERNVGLPPDQRIEFRIGVHLGDVVLEADGDLMGDGVNIAARLEGVAKPGAICLSEDAFRQVKSRIGLEAVDLGPLKLKNIAEPVRAYALEVGKTSPKSKRPVAQFVGIAASLIVALMLSFACRLNLDEAQSAPPGLARMSSPTTTKLAAPRLVGYPSDGRMAVPEPRLRRTSPTPEPIRLGSVIHSPAPVHPVHKASTHDVEVHSVALTSAEAPPSICFRPRAGWADDRSGQVAFLVGYRTSL
jgi:class 3 adenylate cyclase